MSSTSLPALAGRRGQSKKTTANQLSSFTSMDPKKPESQPVTSETFEAKQARLEENYHSSPIVLINRSSLTNWLEEAYAEYDKCWQQGDKVNSLVWDGHIRAFHRCLDAEVTD
jgi:hypothetical protein